MRALDLFCGGGGAGMGLHLAGFEVIGIDIYNQPDYPFEFIKGNAIQPGVKIEDFDFIWASPPCTEYSKRSLPKSWACNGGTHKEPDHSLALATLRIITEVRPKWWIVENVRGAIPYFSTIFGPVQKRCGSRILWGKFPICDPAPGYGKWRLPPSPDRAALRAIIPEQISRALCIACEHQ